MSERRGVGVSRETAILLEGIPTPSGPASEDSRTKQCKATNHMSQRGSSAHGPPASVAGPSDAEEAWSRHGLPDSAALALLSGAAVEADAALQGGTTAWACAVCTLHNDAGALQCGACGATPSSVPQSCPVPATAAPPLPVESSAPFSAAGGSAAHLSEDGVLHGPLALPSLEEEARTALQAINTCCAADGLPFTSTTFPPTQSSLGASLTSRLAQQGISVSWQRPRDISPFDGAPAAPREAGTAGAWQLLSGGRMQGLDVQQGTLGNCTSLSALCTVAEGDPEAAARLFVSTATSPNGVYQVRLCINGMWRVVTVDDCLPVSSQSGALLLGCARRGFLWLSILEKATAAVACEGYASLQGRSSAAAFRLFTGMPVDVIQVGFGSTHTEQGMWRWRGGSGATALPPTIADPHELDAFWARLESAAEAGYFLTADTALHPESIRSDLCAAGLAVPSEAHIRALGLSLNHSFSFVGLELLPFSPGGAMTRAVRIRNPHGRCKYCGPWSFGDPRFWTAARKQAAGVHDPALMQGAGLALLPFKVWCSVFCQVTIARVRPGWQRTAVSLALPAFHPESLRALPPASGTRDLVLEELWRGLPPCPALVISAPSSDAAVSLEVVLSRRCGWLKHRAEADLPVPVSPDKAVDLGAVVLEGDLTAPVAGLELGALPRVLHWLPRSGHEDWQCHEVQVQPAREPLTTGKVTLVPLSFALLSPSRYDDGVPQPAPSQPSWASAGSGAAQWDSHRIPKPAASCSDTSSGPSDRLLEHERGAVVEVHAPVPLKLAVQQLPISALRTVLLALTMQRGKRVSQGTAFAGFVMRLLHEPFGGIVRTVENTTTDKVFEVTAFWHTEAASAADSGVLSTRGAGHESFDRIMPGMRQVMLVLTPTNCKQACTISMQHTTRCVPLTQVDFTTPGHVPAVQGTLHEPEPLPSSSM